MTKLLKKLITAVITVSCLTSVTVLSANAALDVDSYSKFTYDKYDVSTGCSLLNRSGATRYAQTSLTAHLDDGSTKYANNHMEDCANGCMSSCSYFTESGWTHIEFTEFRGTLYSGTSPVGTPLSNWNKTLN